MITQSFATMAAANVTIIYHNLLTHLYIHQNILVTISPSQYPSPSSLSHNTSRQRFQKGGYLIVKEDNKPLL
ncbi:hypothetical protein RCL_jg23054.t1 [Rhizophagus clarus]|uniref:Uncharacterized protein n=1 Tax=Rhizophagus clarus TaxID=94130 RepID=A0A8H3L6L0_9GLOM|nr:hypothetical protein RCL_jg23054.t1 [Rhizophagus clarus]